MNLVIFWHSNADKVLRFTGGVPYHPNRKKKWNISRQYLFQECTYIKTSPANLYLSIKRLGFGKDDLHNF